MHLLVLFVFATYVAGATLMGNKKCTWGPTYWCSHLNHAKDCGAVQHCMTTVWQNEEIKVKSDETCSYCMFLMEELRQLLEDKATDEEIAAAIADACSLLPAGINRNVCKGIITDDLPIVMKLLASRITPSVICYTVGLCLVEEEENIATEITTLERVSLKYQSPEECEICKDVVAEVDNVLRDKTVQDKIKYEIESVGCAKLGSLADKCKLFVEEYLPELFQLLENILDPETVCEGVGLCMVPSSDVKSKTAFGMTMLKPVPLAKECSDCKLLAQILENLVIRNETVKILEDIGEKICQRLPDQMLKDKCIGIVNEYAPTVLAFFKEEFSPVFICRKLGLCSDWTRKEKRKMTSDDRRLKDDARCKMCKLLIQELKNLIANISTADIVAELNKICHYLPGNYSAKCLQDVRQYITPAIDFLKSSDPQVICGLIQACTSESEIRIPVIQTGKVTGSTECEVCGTILLVLKGLLEQNATREEIVQELKKECSLLPLPSELQAECKSIISQYGGKIVDFFVEKMDPYSICKKIQLCKDTNLQVLLPNLTQIPRPFGTFDLFNRNTSNRKTETSRETASGTKCELCKYIVKEIDNLLQKNASEEEIQYALEKACSLFPAAIRQECKMLTDKYITTIIALLLLELDPQRICYDFDFCMPDSALFNRISSAHLDRDACELCKLLATCLKQEIDSNITIKEAEKLLKELCDYFLPDTITAQCEAIVEMYVPDILDQLKEEFNVTEICKKMGCCMKAENLMVKLAGRSAEEKSKINEALHFKPHKTSSSMDECNKGPSFWCASKENAMHCDATQHCELYVWNRR